MSYNFSYPLHKKFFYSKFLKKQSFILKMSTQFKIVRKKKKKKLCFHPAN